MITSKEVTHATKSAQASDCKTVCILEINLAEDHECNSFMHMANEACSSSMHKVVCHPLFRQPAMKKCAA
jgi:hypothetical protein